MPFWSNWSWHSVLKAAVSVGGIVAAAFGPVAAPYIVAGTVAVTGLINEHEQASEDRKRRRKELAKAIEEADARASRNDTEQCLLEAYALLDKAKVIQDKPTPTHEDQKEAHELVTQAQIKVGGIELSVNPYRLDEGIIAGIEGVKERVASERMTWREKLHAEYQLDRAITQKEALEQKKVLQSLLKKIKGDSTAEMDLRDDLQNAIDYVDNKAPIRDRGAIDDIRTDIEDLRRRQRAHEEAVNTLRTSVQTEALTAVGDAENVLSKRADFDIMRKIKEKKGDEASS